MTVFVDTSAIYAFLDADDRNNRSAVETMHRVLGDGNAVTHNYVVVEAAALAQRRLGAAAARALLVDVLPAMRTIWVDEDAHRAGTSAFLAAARRRASLVDWISFELMRRSAIHTAFAFDRDFVAQGFEVIP